MSKKKLLKRIDENAIIGIENQLVLNAKLDILLGRGGFSTLNDSIPGGGIKPPKKDDDDDEVVNP